MSMVNHHEDDSIVHEDLICEILFHLPPLHVLRFKSVSKGWYTIISNPDFLRTHSFRFHLLKPPHEFLFLPQDGHEKQDLLLNLLHHSVFPITASTGLVQLPVVKASAAPAGYYNDLKLVDSCNGLLLYVKTKHKPAGSCCAGHTTVSMDVDDITLYMCNPLITKQYVKLPSIRLILSQDDNKILPTFEYMETRIMFDPYVSPRSYKVISVILSTVKGGKEYKNPGVNNIPIFVYSSETCSWRFSTSICLDDNKPNCFRPLSVYLNGVMYWIGTNLVCFDVEKDRTWFQPMPPIKSYERPQTCYFGVCGGRLRLVEKCTSLRDGFDIMEMATEDGRWTKKYHVNLEGNHLIKAAKSIMILHMYKTGGKNKFKEADDDDEEEDAVLMEIDKELIVSFSLKSNTFGTRKLTIPSSKRFFYDVYPFSITLFPL